MRPSRPFMMLAALGLFLSGLLVPVGGARAAEATLTLTPDRGPCDTRVTLRGEGFPAGKTIDFYVKVGNSDLIRRLPSVVAGADAAVVAEFEPRTLGCAERTPTGTPFVVSAGTGDLKAGEQSVLLARATFTVAPASGGALCFPDKTGQCVAGHFLARWLAHGGLAINGYPISDEFDQVLEDGKRYRVQYFERVRMEYHPENAGTEYDVLLGQFGRRIHPADSPAQALPGQSYVPETGHNLGGNFLAYWQANGGLAQFGYPISEVFEERLEDGNVYRVQYFERARFEHHPELIHAPYDVLLGHFGRLILAEVENEAAR